MIENTESKMIFQIGTVNTFAFNVPFRSTDSIRCFLGNPEDGTELELVSGSDFTVEKKDDYSNGATITLLLDPIPSGKTLAIIRELPIRQELDLPVAGKLPSNALEIQLDKIIMICQQLATDLERAVKVSVTSTEVSAESLLKNIGIAAASAAEAAASAATQAENAATSATKAQDAATRIETLDGFLPLKGGTMTGQIVRKCSSITVGSSAPAGGKFDGVLVVRDANDKLCYSIQAAQYGNETQALLRFIGYAADGTEGVKLIFRPDSIECTRQMRFTGLTEGGITIKHNNGNSALRVSGDSKNELCWFYSEGDFTKPFFRLTNTGFRLSAGTDCYIQVLADGTINLKGTTINRTGYPNYAAGVNYTSSYVAGTGWTAAADGWVFMRSSSASGGGKSVYCNGGLIACSADAMAANAFFPVKKGDKVTIRSYSSPGTVHASATPQDLIFYPNK